MAKTNEEIVTSFKVIRDNILEQLTEMSLEKKPSYDIDGQKVSWTEYNARLMKQLEEINKQIMLFDDFTEFESSMYT